MRQVKIKDTKITCGDEPILCPMTFNQVGDSICRTSYDCVTSCAWFRIDGSETSKPKAYCGDKLIGQVTEEGE